jgi:hypothetical protein
MRAAIGTAHVFAVGKQPMAVAVKDIAVDPTGQWYAEIEIMWTEPTPEPPRRDLAPYYARSTS